MWPWHFECHLHVAACKETVYLAIIIMHCYYYCCVYWLCMCMCARLQQLTLKHPAYFAKWLKPAGSITSFGSMTSIYSEAGGKGDYDITGEVLVGVYYKNSQLHIHVERARGLAAADSNDYSDPYIKTLWLSVLDWDRFGRDLFLGEVRLSLTSLMLLTTGTSSKDIMVSNITDYSMFHTHYYCTRVQTILHPTLPSVHGWVLLTALKQDCMASQFTTSI